jgi:hypothetical protein
MRFPASFPKLACFAFWIWRISDGFVQAKIPTLYPVTQLLHVHMIAAFLQKEFCMLGKREIAMHHHILCDIIS